MDRDEASSPRIDCENRGETVVVPIVLAHVGLEAPDSAFRHLMTDLKRAIAVYERMGRGASRHSPAQQRSFSFEVIEADATALDVSHDASQAFADALRQTRALTDMPVYMLSIAREPRAHAAVDLSERISAICRELDVPWGGAVAMGEGNLSSRAPGALAWAGCVGLAPSASTCSSRRSAPAAACGTSQMHLRRAFSSSPALFPGSSIPLLPTSM